MSYQNVTIVGNVGRDGELKYTQGGVAVLKFSVGVNKTIKVGDETKDKLNYYVMSGKGTDVYLAPKWNMDRVLVKVDDLKKGAAPAGPPPGGPPPGGMPPGGPFAAKNPHLPRR